MTFLEDAFAEMAVLMPAIGTVAKGPVTKARSAKMAATKAAAMAEFLELELGVDELGPGDVRLRCRIAKRGRGARCASEG